MTDFLPAPTRRRIVEPSQIIPPPPNEPPTAGAQPTVITIERVTAPPPRTPITPRPHVTDHTPPPEPETHQPPRTSRIRRPRHIDLSKPADQAPPGPSEAAPGEPEEPTDEPEETTATTSRRRRLARSAADSTTARWRTPRDERQRGRLRVLLITGTAAGIGWQLGYGPFLSASIAELGQADPKWGVGLGLIAVFGGMAIDTYLRRGTPLSHIRGWSLVPATFARVPLATAVLALGLYAPGRI